MFKEFVTKALSYFPSTKELTEKVKRAMLTWRLKRQFIYKIKLEVDKIRQAIDFAKNPLRYDRRLLYAIYNEVELDDQVIAQKRIAVVDVQQAPFEVMQKGKANEELMTCFECPWFHDFLEACVTTEFWGHTLIEFDANRDEDGHLQAFACVDREHVRPNYGDVLIQPTDIVGIPYRDADTFPYLFEIGRPDDLGLYHVVAIPTTRKRYADTDWSLFSERFGSPFLTIKTASRDPKELDSKEEMASNFSSNGWAILDDQDEIGVVTANSNGQGQTTFKDRMALADDQIARLINGQTSTSDEKAHVGAAEVHERVLGKFTMARMKWIQYCINFRLIPFLVGHGYAQLKGAKFEFLELRKKEKEEGGDTEPKAKKEGGRAKPDKGQEPKEAKSERLNAIAAHYLNYIHPDLEEGECC